MHSPCLIEGTLCEDLVPGIVKRRIPVYKGCFQKPVAGLKKYFDIVKVKKI